MTVFGVAGGSALEDLAHYLAGMSMTGLVTAAPHNNSMMDIFARRSKVATRAIGFADVLTPVHVRVFSDCEMRWFYQHLLAVPDPPTASARQVCHI